MTNPPHPTSSPSSADPASPHPTSSPSSASPASPHPANSPSSAGPHIVDFYGFPFFVDQTVLTPRPETEQAIDEVLKLCGRPILPGVKPLPPQLDPSHLTILDVGTGSGCIAITLKKLLPTAEVYASDISPEALQIAQKNAQNLGVPIHTIISYLLEKVNITPNLIVANLPYVDKTWPWLDRESLKTDPDLALYAEDGGLALIKALLDTATAPFLVLEADPSEHAQIISYTQDRYRLINTAGFILVFKKAD